ncbi:MAG: tRNA pseudouridine(55) synthase TruB [Syntrophales bacterium]|nr:tRNA pseudouridine(55) synthase TruB [Syntrophales bacterium]MCK9527516.1 tRNA pseudouridine(55) synthase TruB [Syntrophales bacterium]MDX9922573.1 tRNA pseudouridine(55) synthase TruB [Syntrophales bacterium]
MTGHERTEERKADMSGIVVVDKPAGKTSFDVVRDLRKILGIRKIGHTGTLDPLATGVLPLCINEGTKMAPFLAEDDKEYRATMMLGITTDTQDITGTVLSGRDPGNVTRQALESAAGAFVGRMEQKVPRYSAAKYRGRPHHRWARNGVVLDTPVKEITIHGIEIESFSLPYVTFMVACSKGTYIRTLCNDMGARLGCGAALASLRRTRSGRFCEKNALRLDDLVNGGGARMVRDNLVPLERVLDTCRAITVDDELARRIREGYQPEGGILKKAAIPAVDRGDLVRLVRDDGRMVAVARMMLSPEALKTAGAREQILKLVRVFN